MSAVKEVVKVIVATVRFHQSFGRFGSHARNPSAPSSIAAFSRVKMMIQSPTSDLARAVSYQALCLDDYA